MEEMALDRLILEFLEEEEKELLLLYDILSKNDSLRVLAGEMGNTLQILDLCRKRWTVKESQDDKMDKEIDGFLEQLVKFLEQEKKTLNGIREDYLREIRYSDIDSRLFEDLTQKLDLLDEAIERETKACQDANIGAQRATYVGRIKTLQDLAGNIEKHLTKEMHKLKDVSTKELGLLRFLGHESVELERHEKEIEDVLNKLAADLQNNIGEHNKNIIHNTMTSIESLREQYPRIFQAFREIMRTEQVLDNAKTDIMTKINEIVQEAKSLSPTENKNLSSYVDNWKSKLVAIKKEIRSYFESYRNREDNKYMNAQMLRERTKVLTENIEKIVHHIDAIVNGLREYIDKHR